MPPKRTYKKNEKKQIKKRRITIDLPTDLILYILKWSPNSQGHLLNKEYNQLLKWRLIYGACMKFVMCAAVKIKLKNMCESEYGVNMRKYRIIKYDRSSSIYRPDYNMWNEFYYEPKPKYMADAKYKCISVDIPNVIHPSSSSHPVDLIHMTHIIIAKHKMSFQEMHDRYMRGHMVSIYANRWTVSDRPRTHVQIPAIYMHNMKTLGCYRHSTIFSYLGYNSDFPMVETNFVYPLNLN